MVLYLARRKLGMSVEEWRRLPWWQQRLYQEGLLAESSATAEPGLPPQEEEDSDELDRTSKFGVKVRRA